MNFQNCPEWKQLDQNRLKSQLHYQNQTRMATTLSKSSKLGATPLEWSKMEATSSNPSRM